MDILIQFGAEDGLGPGDIEKFYKLFKDKRYCILVFLKDVESIKPFEINKKGFGIMSAWICIDDIKKIKK